MEIPHDDVKRSPPDKDLSYFKQVLLESDYHEVLTLVEFFLRDPDCPQPLKEKLSTIFDQVQIAYFVKIIDDLPTIVPKESSASERAFSHAMDTVQSAGMIDANEHFRKAVEHLNAENYIDSIKHSIDALESVCLQIAPGTSASGLGKAIMEILKHAPTDEQLRKAVIKLYAYTNSGGIRHPKPENTKDIEKPSLAEAVFLLSQCSSISAYLVSKFEEMVQK